MIRLFCSVPCEFTWFIHVSFIYFFIFNPSLPSLPSHPPTADPPAKTLLLCHLVDKVWTTAQLFVICCLYILSFFFWGLLLHTYCMLTQVYVSETPWPASLKINDYQKSIYLYSAERQKCEKDLPLKVLFKGKSMCVSVWVQSHIYIFVQMCWGVTLENSLHFPARVCLNLS